MIQLDFLHLIKQLVCCAAQLPAKGRNLRSLDSVRNDWTLKVSFLLDPRSGTWIKNFYL